MSSDIKLEHLNFSNLKAVNTIGNGDCFFHSILTATNEEYTKMSPVEKVKRSQEFRYYLANILTDEVYKKLSRGNLKEMSASVDDYKLENMKKTLRSHDSVGNLFNELISNTLNLDIYIVDQKTGDIYITGNDIDLLYKNRPSIVLLYQANHYKLLGIQKDESLITFFQYDHEFIEEIRERMNCILKERIKK